MKLSNKIISDFIETTSNDKSIKKETFIQGYVVKDKNSGAYLLHYHMHLLFFGI